MTSLSALLAEIETSSEKIKTLEADLAAERVTANPTERPLEQRRTSGGNHATALAADLARCALEICMKR